MYELHCPNCGWSTVLSEEQIRAAVAEAERLQATHYVEQCQRCQWVIRTAVSGLQATLPAAPVVEQKAAAAKAPAVQKPKTAPKKAPAKKPAAKKLAAKKPTAKKPAAKKKAAARKPAARKSPAKSKK